MTSYALDIAIFALIFLSALVSYFRGLVKEFFTLAGLILASFSAYQMGHLLVPGLNGIYGVPADGTDNGTKILGILSPPMAAKVTAYGGTFLVVFLLMTLIGFLITMWLKKIGLGVIDRLLGAGYGALRGFVLVFLLFIPVNFLIGKDKMPEWAKQSTSLPMMERTYAWVDKHFDLDKKVEDHGTNITIKLDKVDLDNLGKEAKEAASEVKDEIKKDAQPAPAPAPPAAATPPAPAPTSQETFPQAAPVAPAPGAAPAPTAPTNTLDSMPPPANEPGTP
jgi:membrane protein required for colicin V production